VLNIFGTGGTQCSESVFHPDIMHMEVSQVHLVSDWLFECYG